MQRSNGRGARTDRRRERSATLYIYNSGEAVSIAENEPPGLDRREPEVVERVGEHERARATFCEAGAALICYLAVPRERRAGILNIDYAAQIGRIRDAERQAAISAVVRIRTRQAKFATIVQLQVRGGVGRCPQRAVHAARAGIANRIDREHGTAK